MKKLGGTEWRLCRLECTYDKTNKNIFGMSGILALWRIEGLGGGVGVLRMVWASHRQVAS